MAHAAQVAFTLFADVANKDERQSMPEPNGPQNCSNSQHSRYARTVIGNARTVEAASLLSDVEWRAGGKDRVNVRTERNVTPAETGMNSEHVAHVVAVNVIKTYFLEALGQPRSSRCFTEWRCWDVRHL